MIIIGTTYIRTSNYTKKTNRTTIKPLWGIQYFIFIFLFLASIWLHHGQLMAIIEEAASLTDVNHLCFTYLTQRSRGDPHNEVGSLSPAEHLVGFEPGTFQFWSQHLNPLGHSPQNYWGLSPKLLQITV